MKKNFQNVIVVLMLIALIGCFGQISSLKREMQNLRNNLNNNISNIERNLMNNISYIEELMRKEASILAKAEWSYGELNNQDHTVEIICHITPKEYHPENTTASIMIDNQEIAMELLNGEFVGKGEVSLFGETLVSKTMFYEGDTIQAEALDWTVMPLYEYIPSVNAYLNGNGTSGKENGKYIWKRDGTLEIFVDQKGETVSSETALLIRCIDEIEVERTEIPLDGNPQNGEAYYHDVNLEYEIPYGSKQELYVEIEDGNGLRYRTLFDYMEIDESGAYVDHGSPHDIGEMIIYGKNGEELYRGFW